MYVGYNIFYVRIINLTPNSSNNIRIYTAALETCDYQIFIQIYTKNQFAQLPENRYTNCVNITKYKTHKQATFPHLILHFQKVLDKLRMCVRLPVELTFLLQRTYLTAAVHLTK